MFDNSINLKIQILNKIMKKNTKNLESEESELSWKHLELSILNKEIPTPRWGHSMISTPNKVFIFGGYAGLPKFKN